MITRFSNKDTKSWMYDNGNWWYDLQYAAGVTTDPSVNADMILPAFWMVRGIRSLAVMIPATRHCCRRQGTAWVDKHFDQKSQVMATLEMARFGHLTGACEAARFNMAASTRQQTGFNRLSVVATSKAATRSVSGVIGVMVMDQ